MPAADSGGRHAPMLEPAARPRGSPTPARSGAPTVVAIMYANADHYPAVVNGNRLMAANGFRVRIYRPDISFGLPPSYPPEVEVVRVPVPEGGGAGAYARFLAAVLRAGHGDAIAFIGHDMHGFLPARLLAARHRCPLIYHCHDFTDRADRLSVGASSIRWFEQALARTADLVIVPDADRARVVAQTLGLRRPPVVAANSPLASRPSRESPLQAMVAATGRHFGRIIHRHGSIGPGHALPATIRSIPLLEGKDWGLVLVGWDPNAYRRELDTLAASLGVADRVVVLPPLPYDEVVALASGADLGLAMYDPSPNVNIRFHGTASAKLMEYMAAALPALVSDTPGLRSIVSENACGRAVDATSPPAIAHCINDLFRSDDLLARMGASGAEAFRTRYAYEHQFAPVLDYLKGIVPRKTTVSGPRRR